MRTLVWCGQGMLQPKVPARPPSIIGPTEMRWPPRAVPMESCKPVEFKDEDADRVMERFGPSGIVELRHGESLESAVLRGKRLRHSHLSRQVLQYRQNQAQNQAAGREIQLPSDELIGMMREAKALHTEIVSAFPELAGTPVGAPAHTADVTAELLREFGISPKAAPLIPGVSAELLGIDAA